MKLRSVRRRWPHTVWQHETPIDEFLWDYGRYILYYIP